MTASGAIGSGFLGIAVFVLASASFSVTQAATGPRNVIINNNDCKTNQPTLSILVGDQVSWSAVDQAYTLLFQNSPFTGIASATSVSILRGQTKVSGAVTDQVKQKCVNNTNAINPACRFKYSVSGIGPHACTEDPVVIITH